jgi:ATP-binding cassette subfamily B (MDR/TAP) protein 1
MYKNSKLGSYFLMILCYFLFFYRYTANLVHAKKINVKRAFLMGLGFGFLWFFIYASYALAFWYGVGLVLDDKPKPEDEKVYTPDSMVTVRNFA